MITLIKATLIYVSLWSENESKMWDGENNCSHDTCWFTWMIRGGVEYVCVCVCVALQSLFEMKRINPKIYGGQAIHF